MKYLTTILLLIILILGAFLILQNRELKDIKVTSLDQDSVVMIYVSLSSETSGEEYTTEDVETILGKYFPEATVEETVGYNDGKMQNSLNITILNCCEWKVSDKKFRSKLQKLSDKLKTTLGQEAIVVELEE